MKRCSRMNLKTRRVTINEIKCKLKKIQLYVCQESRVLIQGNKAEFLTLKIFNEVAVVVQGSRILKTIFVG